MDTPEFMPPKPTPLPDMLPAVEPRLPFDATALFEALQYQLIVAIEQCHDLKHDECLWIEAAGDVTVPGKVQIEVKHYADKLTDSHQNFWNTIKNWLHERFDRRSYKALVLLTTQEFGAQSRLKDWNKLNPEQRLSVIRDIASEAGEKFPLQTSSDKTSNRKLSKAEELQHYVLATERHAELIEVLERMLIISSEQRLAERIDSYKTRYLKPIRASRQQQYLDDLLGFVYSPDRVRMGWKITHAAFTSKLSELTLQHMKHPSVFPLVDKSALEGEIDLAKVKEMRFAKKILEIDAEKYLKQAALHRLVAQKTISDLLKDQILSKPVLDLYLNNHRSTHFTSRDLALLNCEGIEDRGALMRTSLMFYLQRLTVPTDPFCGMSSTMPEFRNGIYHILADEQSKDEEEEFLWRLWK